MAATTVWRLQQSSSHSKNPAQVLEGVCAEGQAAVAMQLIDMLRRNNMPLQEEELVALVILCGHPQHEHYMGMVLSEMRQVSPVFLPPSLPPSPPSRPASLSPALSFCLAWNVSHFLALALFAYMRACSYAWYNIPMYV
jgi:hypothetical protein